MKVLALGYEKDSFKFFSDIFMAESKFFDVDYVNFIPENMYYDAIIVESYCLDLLKIKDIPILLLTNTMQKLNDNVILLKNCTPQNIRQMLKQIYEKSIKINNNYNIAIYQDLEQTLLRDNIKTLVFQIDGDNNILKKIQYTLTNYHVPQKIIRSIGIILCELIINATDTNLISIFEFCENKIKLIIPAFRSLFFAIHEFCDSCEEMANKFVISWNK